MTIYTFPLSDDNKIMLWDLKETTAVVQYYSPMKKSRKAVSKIKEYNGKKYITCLGHRYYLDNFKQLDI